MKRKWLIAIASLAMVVTLAFGFAACQPEENGGPSDEEIAQSGITTLNNLYLGEDGNVKKFETPDDYSVVSRVKVEDEFYAVSWSVSSDTENIAQYVSIATEADSSSQYAIDITRATFDIEYKLTASITVGKVTKTTSYSYKIPKKSSEEAVTATLDFTSDAARTSISADQQVWEANGIKLTNDRANSSTATNNAGDNVGHIRWYAGSTVKIEFPGIKIITFHSLTSYEYFDNLQTDLTGAGYTEDQVVVDDAGIATLTLTRPQDVFHLTINKACRILSIDVEGVSGGATDEDKVAVAKEQLTLSKVRYTETGAFDLPATYDGVNLSWSVKETSQYLNVANNKLNITSLPTEETKVTLVAAISSGNAQDTKEIEITVAPASKLEGSGTEDDPYTVADVFELLKEVEAQTYYKVDGKVAGIYVKGIVIDKGSIGDHDNWEKAYIADSADAENTEGVQLYGLDKDSTFLPKDDSLVVGATITVYGALQNWYGGPELSFNGNIRLHAVAYELPVDERTPQEKVTAALEALANTFTVTKAGDTDLPASTVDGVTFAWSATDQTYPIANNKISVTALPAEDATVTATVTATCGTEAVTNNTKTVTITIRAQSSQPEPSEGDGSKDSPFTVSQALDIIKGLASYAYYTAGGSNPVSVYVQGIVTVKGTSDEYGIKNYYIADAAGDTDNDVLVFSLNWSTAVPVGTAIELGDTILIQAYLQNYNGEYEITYWREGTAKPYTYHNGYVEGHTPVGGTVDPDPQPTEGLIYTLTSTTKGENANASDINSYTASSPCTVDGITWDVLGNTQIGSGQYDIPNWRFGGKSGNCNSADRTITGRGAINGTVKSIVITFGGTSGSITVNSVTLKVYSTDPGTGSPTPIAEKTVEWTQNGTYTVTADDAGWTDCYYQLVMNLTSSNASSNKWIAVDNIKFYGGESSVEPQPQPENNGTAEHPFKPSEAVAYGKENLATSGATTTAEVYVKGYVIDKGSWNGTCWQYVYIADDPTYTTKNNADSVIEVYKLYPDSTYLILSGDLIKGREITVHGYLKNYTDKSNKTTYEFDDYTKDDASVHPVASFASTLTREEKLNAAKAAIGNLASDDVISGFDLPAVTVSDVSYAWTVTPTMYAQIVTTQNVSKLQITRPENGTGNQTVTLSLTITCDGTAEQTPLTWELTIKQKPSTTIESELYILPTAHQTSGSNSSYTGNCDVTYNGVKWNIEGNSQSSPWRFGGKASNSTTPLTADRKLTGKTAIQGKVSKVLLTLTDGGGITVNSVTLKVYKTDPTSNGAEAVSTKTVTTYTKDQTITFTAEEGEDWTNCYFEITFNVTITSTSNKYVAISNLEFRGTAVKE